MNVAAATSYAEPPFALPADSVEVVLDLPVPPSVNQTRRIDNAGRGKIKRWRADADMHLLAAKCRTREPLKIRQLSGHFEMHIVISDKLSRIDLDNHVKNLIDYCVSREFVPDDSPKYLRRLIVEWGAAISGCRITIRSLHAG